MEVLISFCNQSGNFGNNLLLIDLETGKKRYLLKNVGGFTGLAQDDEYFYALSQTSPVRIYIIKKGLEKTVLEQELFKTHDPHSIAVDKEDAYIVSTGNDSVLKYKFDKRKPSLDFQKILWKPEDSSGEKDTYHINSIFVFDSQVYVSAFGSKKLEKWSSANEGYIMNITENRKEFDFIYHPHSIFIEGNIFSKKNVYYCESSTKSVKKNNKKIIQFEKGYTRGLCVKNNYLFVGTSSCRKSSKSTGLINNLEDPGFLEEDCRLLVYKENFFNNFVFQKSFDFLPNHKEIYAIIALT